MEAAAWLYPNLELLVQHSIGQGATTVNSAMRDAIYVPDKKMLRALKEDAGICGSRSSYH